MARAELHLQSIPQLMKQAALSFKASIWIFLTIALLSSVYETAIDRATDLSGFSLNFTSTNLTVDFEFRGRSLSQFHSDHKTNDSLLGYFLSGLFASTPTNGTSQELVQRDQIAESPQKDELVRTEGQQFELTDGGNQLIQRSGETINQPSVTEEAPDEKPNELEKTPNEKSTELDMSPGEKFTESGTIEKKIIDSEDAHFEKMAESEDFRDSDTTHKGNLDQSGSDSETAHNKSPSEPESIHPTEFMDESGSVPDLGGKASEDGDDKIQSPLVGSLKIIRRYGNDTKKSTGERLRKPEKRTHSPSGIFNQGALPPGAEQILILVLSIIMLVSVVILLLITFQGSVVMGVAAFAVTSTHMGKRASMRQSLRSGFRSGIWRLMWFAILLGFLQEIQSQFLTKILFGEVLEKEQIEKLVHRLSVMPFAVLAPWKDDLATGIGMFLRIGAFVAFRYMFDWLIHSTYIVGCWVAIIEREYSGREALNRGWNLVKKMAFQAVIIKILEAVFCGRSCSWMLNKVGGQFFAAFTVTLAQTYFLVLWLIFYFAARCKENEGERHHFSHQDLEDFLDKFK